MKTKNKAAIRALPTLCILLLILSLTLVQSPATGRQAGQTQLGYLPLVMRSHGYHESVGVLDPTFDGDGVALVEFDHRSSAEDLLLQPDGKIVTGGYTFTDQGVWDFALARHKMDGSLDSTFDGDGMLTTDFGFDEYVFGVALQEDGKVVAAGTLFDNVYPYDEMDGIILVRYHPDGSLDASFGDGGKVMTDFGDSHWGGDVLIQPDGKILVAGSASVYLDELHMRVFALARYNADGSPDTSFSQDGMLTTSFSQDNDIAESLALQPDGKILAAGTAAMESTLDYAMARYNPDGSLDPNFDGDGLLTVADRGCWLGHSLTLQPDGKIVAATGSCEQERDIYVMRLQPDGSPDLDFGDQGSVMTDWGGMEAPTGVALQPNGKIVVVGYVTIGGAGYSVVMARYLTDASLDESFGYLGRVLTDIYYRDMAQAIAIQEDGRIILAGWSDATDTYDSDFLLLRYR